MLTANLRILLSELVIGIVSIMVKVSRSSFRHHVGEAADILRAKLAEVSGAASSRY
jgi:hypothetical protein